MTDPLEQLSSAGVSIWLDDLSRERIESGDLARLIEERHIVGVTTNPTIFAAALADGDRYAEQVSQLALTGADLDTTIFELTTSDVRAAADILAPVHAATNGVDGRVSIEVEPALARDTSGTISRAQELWDRVDRPNTMIKIPATAEGLPAIADTIARGINVNVTLIFSLERYRGVMDAYLFGLEQASAEGRDLSSIHSVASFFVSRVDSEVDARLPDDSPLRGKAALANAWLAHEAHEQVFSSERWRALEAQGATVQRPLWASTGVKDPAYPDTLYVSELVVPGSVNTMPEKTLEAFADHGTIGRPVAERHAEAHEIFGQLEAAGISYDDVVETLETEGVQKFDDSWAELVATVRDALAVSSDS